MVAGETQPPFLFIKIRSALFKHDFVKIFGQKSVPKSFSLLS